MKSTILLPIPSDLRIIVSIGDEIGPQKVIAESQNAANLSTLPLSQLLNVHAKTIGGHMKKKVGEAVNRGETIAIKKSLFSSISITSPFTGVLEAIDETVGTVTIAGAKTGLIQKLTIPLPGRITHVHASAVEIEIVSKVYDVLKGTGADFVGPLLHFPAEKLEAFDIRRNVTGAVILTHDVCEDTLAKLDAVDAGGCILTHALTVNFFPWVKVTDEVYEDLVKESGTTVWLRPQQKQIIIIS